jgi:HD-like signal output (HDOD) protein
MTIAVQEALLQKLDRLDQMPSLPVTLVPLLHYLEQPLDSLEVQQIVDMISQDKSLTAQCLHIANSPLFGRYQQVDTLRGAVMAIGLQRMRDIVLSCSVLKLSPSIRSGIDPSVFWEHSFACALVARQFAQRIRFRDDAKAYLAGLLHDIGIVVHLWVIPKEYGAVLEYARTHHTPLDETEMAILGITHCHSGRILAERWDLTRDVIDVIGSHHNVGEAGEHRALVSLVSLSDLLCRMHDLGHGYSEDREVDLIEHPAFAVLLEACPELKEFDWARFTFELEGYVDEVHRLVSLLYRGHA